MLASWRNFLSTKKNRKKPPVLWAEKMKKKIEKNKTNGFDE